VVSHAPIADIEAIEKPADWKSKTATIMFPLRGRRWLPARSSTTAWVRHRDRYEEGYFVDPTATYSAAEKSDASEHDSLAGTGRLDV